MRHTRGQVVDVSSLGDFDRRLAAGATSLSGWRLHEIDLRERTPSLLDCEVAGSLFLGCTFAEGEEEDIRARGGIVFPEIPGVPVDTYRRALYTPDDLYDAAAYAATFDARVYAWSQQPDTRESALARALHDHTLDHILGVFVERHTIVGVMGGHALPRGSAAYADAAHLGRLLGARHTVATGGGPGAMEAANLGARLARYSPDDLDAALEMLAGVPSFHPDVGAWAAPACEVVERWPQATASLGIPTWHYGHEPPNPFATAIAKYFRNAVREAILLEVCDAGIIFLPGAAGTVQEIFQDACENFYADESSVAPMVLVGVAHWTQELPAWPLLQALARGRAMEQHVHLVDTVAEAAALFG
ncbi:LOG family protein [Nocardioides sp.]|uniref:LOG family protein n=1 Tax=Nocardioides sp. TaxID=35761 RepID=UPI0027356205|nr:LOG family protein [Nocardioides sp.]MDP3892471.1 LOG family protein [Nocardioides sp.]